jgi:predicted RNase H-like HicB family nuclease
MAYIEHVNEIVFEVTQETDGGFCAECLTEGIFTQGDTWTALRTNVKEAVTAYYFDLPKPQSVRLHLVRDEMLALG